MSTVTTIITCMTEAERPFLREAVASVQAQTVPSGILVCVSDTNTWVDEVLDRTEPGVEVLRIPLAPPGVVRNAAVLRVRSDLVAFLDGDDTWVPSKLERQLALLEAHGLDVIATKHVLVREDGKGFFYAFAQDIPMTSSWLGRTSSFREAPFPSSRVGEDVHVWRSLEVGARCGVAEQFLLRYRVRRGSASQATPSMRRKLAYERRSRLPGARYVLLAGSRLANVALAARRRVRPQDSRVLRVR